MAKIEKSKKTSKVLTMPGKKSKDKIVAVATSTGGPEALVKILKTFPKDIPCPIVIVQHITTGFVSGLVEWLNTECQIEVRIAEDAQALKPGTVYIAPCEMQMRVDMKSKIHLTNDPAYNGHRPSASVLLESVARSHGKNAIGVILTGMGSDGAEGIKAIKEVNGYTIAQDEKSCVVFGMPKVAIDMDVVDAVLPLDKIAEEIIRVLG